jgi:hypothetical protein
MGMDNYFRHYLIGSGRLVYMAFLVLVFWSPLASAFKLDLSYPKTVNENEGTLSIAISLRAESGDVGSCRITVE